MYPFRRATLLCTMLMSVALGCPTAPYAAPDRQDASRHLYDRVMEEFKQGDYEAALAGFRFFLELHRKSALAANAQYWIGECQFRLSRYHEALQSFSNVASYDGRSPKVAASAFKIGQIYSALGDYYRANLTFDELLDHYPGGPEAQLAQKAMLRMSAKAGSKPPLPVKNGH